MESLYRKYRPLTFESVVGQQHIVSTLEHAVTEGRLNHAYLFCGPRGTGKTTMARILAKALLCERAKGARAQGASGCMPDGDCPECRSIAEGSHPDVFELDAASRTGVDNVREEIINSVSFAPVRGAYKIYIIDEVHMLTTAAFNALLKTLEEPPSHVLFVLCTTDPQKIPETILSRCQRFDFHRIGLEDIVGRLGYICEQEGFEYDADALEIVAKHARGGMRDALSTLEQLSVFGNGSVRASDARALLGEVSGAVLSQFSQAIAVRDVAGLFGLVRAQVDEGSDLMELTRDLVSHVRDIYMVKVAGARPELFDAGAVDIAPLVAEAERFETADRLARVLTVLDDAALEMRSAADTRLVLEIALTRLARPESDMTLEALAERLERLERRVASGVPSGPMDARAMAALGGQARDANAPAVPHTGSPVRAEAASTREAKHAPTSANGARTDRPQTAAAQLTDAGDGGDVVHDEAAASVSDRNRAEHVASGGAHGVVAAEPARLHAEAAPVAAPVSAEVGLRDATPVAQAAAPAAESAVAAAAPAVMPAEPAASASVVGTSAADAPAAEEFAPTAAVSDAGELQRRWNEVIKRVIAARPSRGALLQSSRAQSDDGSALTVSFPPGSGFAITMLGRPDTQEVVLPQVKAVFGTRALHYVMDGAAKPAAVPAAPQASAPVASEPSPQQPTVRPVPAATPAPQAAPVPRQPASQPMSSAAPTSSATPSQSDVSPAASQAASRAASQAEASRLVQAPASESVEPRQTVSAAPATDDEQVPYDDDAAMMYEDDYPPFDMPEPSPTPEPASAGATSSSASSSAPASPAAAAAPVAPASVVVSSVPAPESAAPANPSPAQTPTTPFNASPLGALADDISGDNPDDVVSVLGSVFGVGVKVTPINPSE